MIRNLLEAIENNNVSKVREILNSGVDINVEKDGEFPLETACWIGNKEVVELLIENGADVNFADECEFRTSLMLASRHGHTEIVKLLIEHGADVNAGDDYDATSLTRAAEAGHIEVVKLLIENGANPNWREERDKTAEELARESGHINIANFIQENKKTKLIL